MSGSSDSVSRRERSLLSLRGGGWVILLAAVMTAGVLAWRLPALLRSRGAHAIGDGETVASYGFDLSTCLIPRGPLVAAGFHKDGVRALVDPLTITAAEADTVTEQQRGKFLVPSDRVVGVSINGETRAYPLRILAWHEIVNDTLGGWPIAVTYSPLCDAVVVFDRRVAGESLTFGVSGLLYNSNLLMYDRRPEARGESLWCQLQCRAVAGPAAKAGQRLKVVPAALARWSEWRERHPGTHVLAADPALAKRYKREPYASYFGSDRLHFPVEPLPPDDGLAMKTRVAVIGAGGERRVFLLSSIDAQADADGTWRTEIGGVPVDFAFCGSPPSVFAEAVAPETSLETFYCCWFAWYAMHPGAKFE
jgi:hypothetical protein